MPSPIRVSSYCSCPTLNLAVEPLDSPRSMEGNPRACRTRMVSRQVPGTFACKVGRQGHAAAG